MMATRSNANYYGTRAFRRHGHRHSHTSGVCAPDTYFLFPFALDKDAIQADHPQAWSGNTKWIDGLDSWIAGESGRREPPQGMAALGSWRRSSYSSCDLDSPGYPDLLFFHSVVRYVFFDTNLTRHADDQQNQLRCYAIDLNPPHGMQVEHGRQDGKAY